MKDKSKVKRRGNVYIEIQASRESLNDAELFVVSVPPQYGSEKVVEDERAATQNQVAGVAMMKQHHFCRPYHHANAATVANVKTSTRRKKGKVKAA